MATIIRTDGTHIDLDLSNEATRLEKLQVAVGGYIEVVYRDPNGNIVLGNEEGLPKGLPINKTMSDLAGAIIVGDVVVTTPEEGF